MNMQFTWSSIVCHLPPLKNGRKMSHKNSNREHSDKEKCNKAVQESKTESSSRSIQAGKTGSGQGRTDVTRIPKGIGIDPDITEGHPGYEESGSSELDLCKRTAENGTERGKSGPIESLERQGSQVTRACKTFCVKPAQLLVVG